jgi:hypothetical protein
MLCVWTSKVYTKFLVNKTYPQPTHKEIWTFKYLHTTISCIVPKKIQLTFICYINQLIK